MVKICEDFHEQAREVIRKKTSRAGHNGRLPLPEHLPVEEVHIHPDGDLSGMERIGQEVTDELEIQPARLYIKRYIRHKYAPAGGRAPCIGALPDRVIDKGIAGPGLLATILVVKYADHLPLYRQRHRFAREGIPIAQSTLDGWASQAIDRLEILWDHLATDSKTRGYLQVDESPIKVLESPKRDPATGAGIGSATARSKKRYCLTTSQPAGHLPQSDYWMNLQDTFRPMAMRL